MVRRQLTSKICKKTAALFAGQTALFTGQTALFADRVFSSGFVDVGIATAALWKALV